MLIQCSSAVAHPAEGCVSALQTELEQERKARSLDRPYFESELLDKSEELKEWYDWCDEKKREEDEIKDGMGGVRTCHELSYCCECGAHEWDHAGTCN